MLEFRGVQNLSVFNTNSHLAEYYSDGNICSTFTITEDNKSAVGCCNYKLILKIYLLNNIQKLSFFLW